VAGARGCRESPLGQAAEVAAQILGSELPHIRVFAYLIDKGAQIGR
jgi:hypothetical protein